MLAARRDPHDFARIPRKPRTHPNPKCDAGDVPRRHDCHARPRAGTTGQCGEAAGIHRIRSAFLLVGFVGASVALVLIDNRGGMLIEKVEDLAPYLKAKDLHGTDQEGVRQIAISARQNHLAIQSTIEHFREFVAREFAFKESF
jgi:hypothetical protein